MRVKAFLIARNTADGMDFVRDEVPLGKVYWIDPASIRDKEWVRSDRPGTIVRQVVKTYSGPKGMFTGFFPLELLKVKES